MKFKILAVFCLVLVSVTTVNAGSDQSYNDFLGYYRNYQNQLSPFNVAKSKYLTYGSVISQGEYLDAAKNLINSEIASINGFTLFLIDYLNEANETIGLTENNVLVKLSDLQSRTSSLSGRQNLVDSLESAQIVMLEVKDLYGEMYRLAYWSKSTVESAGVKKIYDNLGIVIPKLGTYIMGLPATYRENQAAREKFRSLENSYNLIADDLSSSYIKQKNFDGLKVNPLQTEEEVHKDLQESISDLYSLILGYRNILFAVKKG